MAVRPSLSLSRGLSDLFLRSGLHQGPLCSGGSLHVSLLPNTSVSSAITCVVGNSSLPSGSSGKSSPGREAIAGQYG